MHMRLMLLGGGNALGQALLRQGTEENIEFIAPVPPVGGWTPAALTQLLDEQRPDALLNLAYYHDWLQAHQPCMERSLLQEQSVQRLAELCLHHDIILIQPSSYRVFDGSRTTAYSEKDEVHPLGLQGQALWQFEQLVRTTCPRHILLRLGWLLDESREGMLARLLQAATRAETLTLADDRRGNPTLVDDAARVLLAIVKQLDCNAPLWGTYHYGAIEAATSLALGQAILAEARRYQPGELQGTVTPQPHTLLPDATEEPQHAVLACKKILHTFGVKPRAWRAGLSALLERYYRHL